MNISSKKTNSVSKTDFPLDSSLDCFLVEFKVSRKIEKRRALFSENNETNIFSTVAVFGAFGKKLLRSR